MISTGVTRPTAPAMRDAGQLPDGTDRAVQVGRFAVVEPPGINVTGGISIMSIPVTDSLAGTIAEKDPKVHRAGARVARLRRLVPAARLRYFSSF
jgi:hypothetical protein